MNRLPLSHVRTWLRLKMLLRSTRFAEHFLATQVTLRDDAQQTPRPVVQRRVGSQAIQCTLN